MIPRSLLAILNKSSKMETIIEDKIEIINDIVKLIILFRAGFHTL